MQPTAHQTAFLGLRLTGECNRCAGSGPQLASIWVSVDGCASQVDSCGRALSICELVCKMCPRRTRLATLDVLLTLNVPWAVPGEGHTANARYWPGAAVSCSPVLHRVITRARVNAVSLPEHACEV